MQTHPASENGNPLVDNQAMAPKSRLDDPGNGLRGNGRKVLSYAMLKSTFADPDGRDPSREIELHLTGHMEKFAWSFNGRKMSAADPIRLTYGERMRIVLVNESAKDLAQLFYDVDFTVGDRLPADALVHGGEPPLRDDKLIFAALRICETVK